MQKELFVQLWTNIHSIEHTSIRLDKSNALSREDALCLQNALFVWCGTTLEKASATLDESSFKQFWARFKDLPRAVLLDERGFSSFLEVLDEVDDIISKVISLPSSHFKGGMLLRELRSCLSRWSPNLWRTLALLYSSILKNMSVECVRFLRLQSNLMSKVSIDRRDLLSGCYSDYKKSECQLLAECSSQSQRLSPYWSLVTSMRFHLRDVINGFNPVNIVPKHGPGAVADPKVKDKVDKYLNLNFDSRIDYMLRKDLHETMELYSPFPLGPSSRTSRVIYVPKTWKKLRGISAEPAGLQYFQQGVMRAIGVSIARSKFDKIIDLSDQGRSREMAQRGSFDGSLATIDLSSASDSVTLQLVKDIFGTSDLCRWLLATRSTHTLLDQEVLRINKFAPMGSACCFPVECLIFSAAVLATATMFHGSQANQPDCYRVYGDDIICPTFMAEDVMTSLQILGFSVNSGKSYWSGDYRESCGMDAWRGFDVTPLKLKDFSFDFNGSKPCSYEHQSRIVSYLNTLYFSGYKHTRSFLLEKFLQCKILARGQRFKVADSLVFGDGERGTLFSPSPDNFHLKPITIRGYQRKGYKKIIWKRRRENHSVEAEQLRSEASYFERLMVSRPYAENDHASYDLSWFIDRVSENPSITSKDHQMVPSFGVHDPWVPEVSE